jgi:MFS family permease
LLFSQQNTALYSTFAVFGFFGGTFVNRLGVKWTLAFGGIGYCIYAISLLVSVHASVGGFNIFAGALLGVCAGLLWTAQGTIMISYPNEGQKGRYFAWFWGIFNMGAVIGGLVSFQFLPGNTVSGCNIFGVLNHHLTFTRSLSAKISTSRPTAPSPMEPISPSSSSCSAVPFSP